MVIGKAKEVSEDYTYCYLTDESGYAEFIKSEGEDLSADEHECNRKENVCGIHVTRTNV